MRELSLWLDEAFAPEASEPVRLEEGLRADVCIVGGGFTGLWTALSLKERAPSLDVVIVEASLCGSGASGRNGGFVMSWWSKFPSLRKQCGTAQALWLARASADGVAEIGAFCDANRIDAHFRPDGWLWTATSLAQRDAWRATIDQLEAAGERPFEKLPDEEIARRAGSSIHLAGVFEPSAASVQPALLARGLARVARERGVRIFEHSPMVALERSRPPRVRTRRGEVTADCVVLAMNAWGARIREFRRSFVVISSDIVATEPAPDRLAGVGWTSGLCISDSRRLVNYYRTTRDGRIVFGKGGGTLAFASRVDGSFHGTSPRAEEVAAHFRRLYPSLADVPIARSWRGPIDYSLTGLPFFTRLGGRPDILFGAGYSGNGVGPSLLGGRILASLAIGAGDEWSSVALTEAPRGALPPEPVRLIGGLAVRRAIARKESAEDSGRAPSVLDAALAKLDPTSFIDRGAPHRAP